MMNHQTHSGFQLPRRVAGAFCFYLSVASLASLASAIGVVISVLVLTAPTRTASFDAILPIQWSGR